MSFCMTFKVENFDNFFFAFSRQNGLFIFPQNRSLRSESVRLKKILIKTQPNQTGIAVLQLYLTERQYCNYSH